MSVAAQLPTICCVVLSCAVLCCATHSPRGVCRFSGCHPLPSLLPLKRKLQQKRIAFVSLSARHKQRLIDISARLLLKEVRLRDRLLCLHSHTPLCFWPDPPVLSQILSVYKHLSLAALVLSGLWGHRVALKTVSPQSRSRNPLISCVVRSLDSCLLSARHSSNFVSYFKIIMSKVSHVQTLMQIVSAGGSPKEQTDR